MNNKTNGFIKLGAVFLLLWAVFHIAIGVYHTVLFSTQGPQSMFSTAYGKQVTAADMEDPARLLGAHAIEVYSILLFGYGVLGIWATVLMLKGQRLGFWLNTVMMGIAQLAILYGLIIPGQLTGANAYVDLALYLLGVLLGGIGFFSLHTDRA